ncbi:MFS transporter [Aquiflexum lacus]|uniref:MFS transporter n=1 Tax=Aquiflexum lacus TaxID=2483805 RepID=UPI0018933ED4|nr:MFS transporter [Aquiflexum lacus]
MIKNFPRCKSWSQSGTKPIANIISVMPTVMASIAMSVGGMADAFLYAYLPVYAPGLGLGNISLGIILSVNKFVRLFFNRWVNVLAHTLGLRNILIAALLLGAITSFTYQLNMPLWLWIISRISWGAAYAMFRFSSIQYSALAPSKGQAIGLITALREIGPITAYLIGPLILSIYGPEVTFAASSILTLAFIPLVVNLPLMKSQSGHHHSFSIQKVNCLDLWTFLSGFIVDGLIVVSISLLIDFKEHHPTNSILVFTAGLISLRRVLQIVIAPISGWLVQKIGYKATFLWSSFAFIPGLLLLTTGNSTIGIVLLSTAAVVNNVTLPLFALFAKNTIDNYNTFTKLVTAKDIGGALGALSGVYLIQQMDYSILFTILLIFISTTLFKTFKFVKHYGANSTNS